MCSFKIGFTIIFLLVYTEVSTQTAIRKLMKDFPWYRIQNFEQPHPDTRTLGPGLFNHSQPVKEVYSSGNQLFAGTKDGKIYLRAANTDSILLFISPEEGSYWHMDNAMWTHDGRFLIAKQIDDRQVPEIILINKNKEKIKEKYSRAGEKIPLHQFYVIDAQTSRKVAVEQRPGFPYVHVLSKCKSGESFFVLESDRLMKQIHILEVDATSGKATTLLTEESDSYIIGLYLLQGYSNRLLDMNIASFLEDKNQFIWMSERSGLWQLYLYDMKGDLIRPLTNKTKNGIISSVEAVDKENGWIYFLAHANPEESYSNQLFKASLNSDDIIKISDAPGITEVFLSDNADTLWILRSGLPNLLQLDGYSSDGTFYGTLWKSDFSKVPVGELNFEYEWVKAPDDSTKIQALLLKPKDLDSSNSYPVVEYIYGAPFNNMVPKHLLTLTLWQMNRLAQKGFIIAFIDGRGTDGRGRELRNFSYGRFGQVELQDHIYALKQLAAERPYMDLNRVGIYGQSWGGHFALRALIEAPEFYKAGHIGAAALDPDKFRVAIEPFMGCLPQDCPEQYAKSAISNKLDQLQAPLMIVHGTFDDDVPIDDAYALVEKLEQLKYDNYEFITYKGKDHFVISHPKWFRQMKKFFVTELNAK